MSLTLAHDDLISPKHTIRRLQLTLCPKFRLLPRLLQALRPSSKRLSKSTKEDEERYRLPSPSRPAQVLRLSECDSCDPSCPSSSSRSIAKCRRKIDKMARSDRQRLVCILRDPRRRSHQEKRSEVIYGNLNNLWTIIDIITLSPIA